MKFGIQLAGGAPIRTRTAIKEIAAVAEELGFDSLLIGDHIVIPKKITAPWPYTEYFGGKTPYAAYTEMEWFDPFDTMAFLAGITEKVRLGISVLIVPYRHPFDMARRVATIDVLSGGRFVLGVGVGWLEDEFRLLNIPFTERAQRTREYIQVMKLLWTQEKPRFHGNSSKSMKISICYPIHCRNHTHRFGWVENRDPHSSAWRNSAMVGTLV